MFNTNHKPSSLRKIPSQLLALFLLIIVLVSSSACYFRTQSTNSTKPTESQTFAVTKTPGLAETDSFSEPRPTEEPNDRTHAQSPTTEAASGASESFATQSEETAQAELPVVYGEPYTSPEEVAAYLFYFSELPPNFITKDEAYDLGWEPQYGNLWEVAPGCSIGGDRFGNREGLLPDKQGRQYYECDIDYEGGRRNAKRIVFSNDGLIYYTDDHYASFERLY